MTNVSRSLLPFLALPVSLAACAPSNGGNNNTQADAAMDAVAADVTPPMDAPALQCRPIPTDWSVPDAGNPRPADGGTAGPRNEDFTCLGGLSQPSASAMSADVLVSVYPLALDGRPNPLAGALVKACAADDTACATPLDQCTTDSRGKVLLRVPLAAGGFRGYFEVSSGGIMTTLHVVNPPVTQARAAVDIDVVPRTLLSLVGSMTGATPATDRGHVVMLTKDCRGDDAQGVAIAVTGSDTSSTPFYTASGGLTAGANQTSDDGIGGVLNVPPGTRTATWTHRADNNRVIGSVPVVIRAATVTFVPAIPMP